MGNCPRSSRQNRPGKPPHEVLTYCGLILIKGPGSHVARPFSFFGYLRNDSYLKMLPFRHAADTIRCSTEPANRMAKYQSSALSRRFEHRDERAKLKKLEPRKSKLK